MSQSQHNPLSKHKGKKRLTHASSLAKTYVLLDAYLASLFKTHKVGPVGDLQMPSKCRRLCFLIHLQKDYNVEFCRFDSKSSTFSSVILRTWMLPGLGLEYCSLALYNLTSNLVVGYVAQILKHYFKNNNFDYLDSLTPLRLQNQQRL